MEVDRVSRMGGVGRDGAPAWPKGATRRRKFVEEIAEPERETEESPAPATAEAEVEGTGAVDVMA
jgi:hypothetical protein